VATHPSHKCSPTAKHFSAVRVDQVWSLAHTLVGETHRHWERPTDTYTRCRVRTIAEILTQALVPCTGREAARRSWQLGEGAGERPSPRESRRRYGEKPGSHIGKVVTMHKGERGDLGSLHLGPLAIEKADDDWEAGSLGMVPLLCVSFHKV
jgi:hypothetical protein